MSQMVSDCVLCCSFCSQLPVFLSCARRSSAWQSGLSESWCCRCCSSHHCCRHRPPSNLIQLNSKRLHQTKNCIIDTVEEEDPLPTQYSWTQKVTPNPCLLNTDSWTQQVTLISPVNSTQLNSKWLHKTKNCMTERMKTPYKVNTAELEWIHQSPC